MLCDVSFDLLVDLFDANSDVPEALLALVLLHDGA